MTDIANTLRAFNAGRDPERLTIKYAKMRSSSYVFLRATCHLFYDRLLVENLPRDAPLGWICGDLHLENFGSYKGENRLVYFDINDFDESALAPVSWDLVRLLASISVAAKTLRIGKRKAESLSLDFIAAYCDTLKTGKATWIERDTASGLIEQLLDGLKDESRVEHLDKFSDHSKKKRSLRCDGVRALKADKKDRDRVIEWVDAFAKKQQNSEFFQVLDVARRIAGVGSLGVERYVILVRGRGSPDNNYLLDLKASRPSCLARHLEAITAQPKFDLPAHRIVAVQTRMQAEPMAFLNSVAKRKSSYVLRGLQPSENRVALDDPAVKFEQISEVITHMGRVVASAQLRSAGRQGSANVDALIAFASTRKTWQDPLLKVAQQSAAQNGADWEEYCDAYDAGAFAVR